jgi:hypothetical protein
MTTALNIPITDLPVSKLPDADMQAVPAALYRSAQRAREIAVRTGTPLIVYRDGKVVEEWVELPDETQGDPS